ncbi:hypothetical protein CPB84DRAFT_1797439 [Gymnopilus junonius]|uniref:Uncharacterized protein n=1 Tax=Gymnopilus junonius TaxID=109634 RepID=A0A9P5TGE1_GYMJU|nr:hypothetical protein CPB84DRAFT_1797439 [Gymnopilus junonius]
MPSALYTHAHILWFTYHVYALLVSIISYASPSINFVAVVIHIFAPFCTTFIYVIPMPCSHPFSLSRKFWEKP